MEEKDNSYIKIITLLFSIQIMASSSGSIMGILAPFLINWDLSKTQLGLFTTTYFLMSSVTGFSVGWLINCLGSKVLLLSGQLLIGASLIAVAFAKTSLTAYLFLAFAGLGNGAIGPTTNKIVVDWIPSMRRGFVMGLKQTSVTIGVALMSATLPLIALLYSWRISMLIWGLIVLITAGISYIYYIKIEASEGMITHQKAFESGSRPSLKSILTLFKSTELAMISITAMVFFGMQHTLNTYLMLYLKEDLTIPIATAGFLLSIMQWVASGGRVIWGLLSDRWFEQNRSLLLVILGGISFFGGVLLGNLHQGTAPLYLILILSLIGLGSYGWNGIYMVTLTELNEKEVGLISGLSLSISSIGVIMPTIFGKILDIVDSFSKAWNMFFLLVGMSTLLLLWRTQKEKV